MRCKTCHYSLKGLAEDRCPECGRAFDPNDPATYYDPLLNLSPAIVAPIAVLSYGVSIAFYFYLVLVHEAEPFTFWVIPRALIVAFFMLPGTLVIALLVYAFAWSCRNVVRKFTMGD